MFRLINLDFDLPHNHCHHYNHHYHKCHQHFRHQIDNMEFWLINQVLHCRQKSFSASVSPWMILSTLCRHSTFCHSLKIPRTFMYVILYLCWKRRRYYFWRPYFVADFYANIRPAYPRLTTSVSLHHNNELRRFAQRVTYRLSMNVSTPCILRKGVRR
jgi:hypothetical protein